MPVLSSREEAATVDTVVTTKAVLPDNLCYMAVNGVPARHSTCSSTTSSIVKARSPRPNSTSTDARRSFRRVELLLGGLMFGEMFG